jgi:hypothetical protein
VGAFGVLPALVKMSTDKIGVDIDISIQESLQENLYEAVVVVARKDKANFEAALESLKDQLSFKKIGMTNAKSEINFTDGLFRSLSADTLKYQSKVAWLKAFPELK